MAKGPISPDDLLTTTHVAAELGVTVTRVLVLIKGGRIKAARFGKSWMIRRADLDPIRNRPTGVHLADWRAKKKQLKPDEKKKKS